ncbi:hypothetical protein [Photobacterium sp. Alg240-V54]|uniref:hypothetical protein n=1 Tax=Photobacterium sp. Alg240-V54 TaxID=2305995 RepID=UPI0013D748A6|nr:hypothetical protein [Photobacterium sp. Alg240-V54]
MTNSKLNLVCFYSEGFPYDRGLNLSVNKENVIDSASNFVDNISFYTPRLLKHLGYIDYVKEFNNRGLVYKNPGMNHVGFCAWRPLILLLELENMSEGDILIYRDVNIEKYPILSKYKNIKEKAIEYLDLVDFDIFVPAENDSNKVSNFAKKNMVEGLAIDSNYSSKFPLLLANFIIIRKSKLSISLLEEWKNACLNEKYINGNVYGLLYSDFRWSTPEQSILSVIFSNYCFQGIINKDFPKIYFNGRDYTKPVLFNSNNFKLPNNNKLPEILNTIYVIFKSSFVVFSVDVLSLNKLKILKRINIKLRKIFIK